MVEFGPKGSKSIRGCPHIMSANLGGFQTPLPPSSAIVSIRIWVLKIGILFGMALFKAPFFRTFVVDPPFSALFWALRICIFSNGTF